MKFWPAEAAGNVLCVFCALLWTVLCGCGGSGSSSVRWKDLKVTDIAPSDVAGAGGLELIETVNVDVHVIEVSDGAEPLQRAWDILRPDLLSLNDHAAFGANSFAAGYGQGRQWDELVVLLNKVGARKIKTAALLLNDGGFEDVRLSVMEERRTLFYITSVGQLEGVTLDTGGVGLRIRAQRIEGSRGVCRLDVVPVYTPWLPQHGSEKVFNAAGFSFKTGPGGFVLLGPAGRTRGLITLDGTLFERPTANKQPAARYILIVCAGIIERS